MKHQECLELIKSAIYDDLNNELKAEFEEHISGCPECKNELSKQEKLLNMMNKIKISKPDEKLLQEARMELRGALRRELSQKSFFLEITEKITQFFSSGPGIAFSGAIILLIGFFAGYLTFHPTKLSIPEKSADITRVNEAILSSDNTRISNVRLINKDLQSGEIEFSFEASKPIHVKGNMDDPRIQNLLMYAMLNEPNPGIRLNTINAIDKDQPSEINKDVKDALIKVAETDENAGVRRAALQLLQKFPLDDAIKKALLFILSKDPNSALRIEAINNLMDANNKGANFNSEDIKVFKEKMRDDENNYIRYAAKNVVERRK
jgi:HEAT repeats/Putative zinc-finger